MNAIHILPLGGASPGLIDGIRAPLRDAFRASVDVRSTPFALDRFLDESRGQYNSTSLLLRLKEEYSDRTVAPQTRALAVVPFDLFIPILTYVFGEAEVGGNVAVVSYYRLAPERYGLPSDESLLRARLLKEAVHELGHAYALIHCSSQKCVMHASSYVEEIDLKGAEFCTACASALKHHDASTKSQASNLKQTPRHQ
ncbi:MAG: archaemetzincin family Zn-dependent metalloprotease [Bacteroidota bacterium]